MPCGAKSKREFSVKTHSNTVCEHATHLNCQKVSVDVKLIVGQGYFVQLGGKDFPYIWH